MSTTAKELIEAAKDVLERQGGHHIHDVCNHILATVREDDDEPVTRERMESEPDWYWDRVSQQWRLTEDRDPNGDHGVVIRDDGSSHWSGGFMWRRLKSMGHLRRLVAALGE